MTIDRYHYINCENQEINPNDNTYRFSSYWVKKYHDHDGVNDNYYFVAAFDEDALGVTVPPEDEWNARAVCRDGEIIRVDTHDGACRCGIATMLSFMCMEDTDVMGDPNSEVGYDISRTVDGINGDGRNIPLKECVTANYNRVVQIINTVDEANAGRGYLNAAKDAGFGYLITSENAAPWAPIVETINAALQNHNQYNDHYAWVTLYFCKPHGEIAC